MNITYFITNEQAYCGREIIAIATVDATDVNSGFKQFVIAVDCYATTNPL